MKKILTAIVLLGTVLVSSFGFTSCKDTPITPNFENFPLDIQASLRWGTGSDAGIYLDLTITNNSNMDVKYAWYFMDSRGLFDTAGTINHQRVSRIEFPNGGLKPHATIEITLGPNIIYVYKGDVATVIECDLIFWWVIFDKKGADWGDPKIEERCLEDAHNGSLNLPNCYSEGYHVDVANSKNPY